jgi:hypothetical protein
MADESGRVRLIEPMFLMNGRPIEQELCPRAPPSDKKPKKKMRRTMMQASAVQ